MGESCGHVKVASFCPFAWHTGLCMRELRATVKREQWNKMGNKFTGLEQNHGKSKYHVLATLRVNCEYSVTFVGAKY